jgi:hypothetical protein
LLPKDGRVFFFSSKENEKHGGKNNHGNQSGSNGRGIAAAVAAANKSKAASAEASKIEKSISELSAKFDKMAEQLKVMQ